MRCLWMLMLGGCVAEVVDKADPVDTTSALLVMATAANDYSVGALTVMALDDPGVTQDVATIHGDAVVRVQGGALWQINRLLVDTVRRYDPSDWTEPVFERSTGPGSNPHDVAVCGGLAFASLYEEDGLAVFDVDTGADRGRVSLADWADDDGVPEVSDLVVYDGRLFAALQRLARLDGWTDDAGGRLVEVDCDTLEVVDSWETGPNPVIAKGGAHPWLVTSTGVRSFDGVDVGTVELHDVDGAQVVGLAMGDDGRGAFIARTDGVHTLGCVDASDWMPRVARVLPNYVADVIVDDGVAWFAVRQSWAEPDTRGGIVGVGLEDCAEITPDGGLQSTFPPFSMGIWR